jgi:hypothetical protein
MSWRRRIDRVSCGVGRSMLAGLAGTTAITLSQLAEMRLTHRGPTSTPAQAAEKVLGIRAVDQQHAVRLTNMVHWGYGTSWGLFRGILDAVGVRGYKASLIQWAVITGTATTMLPKLDVAPPAHKWPIKMHVSEGMHHLVYATALGYAYDWLKEEPNRKCCGKRHGKGWFGRRRGRSRWLTRD